VERLQHHHRGHHARQARRPPPPRREQVREILIAEQFPAVRRQEREHAPGRHQVTNQRPGIQQLPVRPLFALHMSQSSQMIEHTAGTNAYRPDLYSVGS
jgi:hypothetical protein